MYSRETSIARKQCYCMQILYTIRQSKNVISHCQDAVQFDAVAVGAILSDYQRVRVENV